MNKEARLSFRIQPKSHEEFFSIIEVQNRIKKRKGEQEISASDLIRDFINQFIEEHKALLPFKNTEQSLRAMNVREGIANVELEGYTLSDSFKTSLDEYIQGTKSIDELIASELAK